MAREVWMPVVGYETFYEVSNLGNIRRDINSAPSSGTWPGRLLTPSVSAGYMHVSLSRNGSIENVRIHCAVMQAFCGEPPFDGAMVCHNDGDSLNCRLTNLRWDTAAGNQADVERHGNRRKGSRVFGAMLDDESVVKIRERIADGCVQKDLAEEFGVSCSTISLIGLNKIWRHVS